MRSASSVPAKITIVAVGRLKERHWREAAEEYLKRLTPYASVQIAEVSDREPTLPIFIAMSRQIAPWSELREPVAAMLRLTCAVLAPFRLKVIPSRAGGPRVTWRREKSCIPKSAPPVTAVAAKAKKRRR